MDGMQSKLSKFFNKLPRAPRVEVAATTSGTSSSDALTGETLASPQEAMQPAGASNEHQVPNAQTTVEATGPSAPKIQSTLRGAWGLEQQPVIPPAIKANKPHKPLPNLPGGP